MSQTYCGKNCETCSFREELSCPGCQAGPGKKYNTECDLAKCCQSKGHETCETCQILPHCGQNRGKERIPQNRIRHRQEEAEHRASIRRRTPILGKWLWLLFWLLIPQFISDLILEDFVLEAIPGMRIPGLVLKGLCLVAECVILYRLSQVNERYNTAAVFTFIAGALVLLANILTGGEEAGWTVILTIPAAICSMAGVYNTYHAHADAIGDFEGELAYKWERLWKWEIGTLALTFGSILLVALAPVLGLLAMLAGLIGSLVVSIVAMVYLYHTAQTCREITALDAYKEQAERSSQ